MPMAGGRYEHECNLLAPAMLHTPTHEMDAVGGAARRADHHCGHWLNGLVRVHHCQFRLTSLACRTCLRDYWRALLRHHTRLVSLPRTLCLSLHHLSSIGRAARLVL